jgi:hypothetical protein
MVRPARIELAASGIHLIKHLVLKKNLADSHWNVSSKLGLA